MTRNHFLRRAGSALLALGLTLSLTACGGETPAETEEETNPPAVSEPEETPEPPETTPPADETESQEHILIAYFTLWENAPWGEATDTDTSASVVVGEEGAVGTNAYVANMIQQEVGGDLHAIMAAEPYPADFQEVIDANHGEDSRAISDTVEHMEQYDTVFVGYPIWAGGLPQVIRTFLSSYDLSEKTVIPFCTHDGYGSGSSFSTVAELSGGAQVLDGLAIEASDVPGAQETVRQWLAGLDLPEDTDAETASPQGETALRITVNGHEVEGVLYDSAMAEQFLAQLPQTISMSNYGGREVYGRVEQEISVEGEGQLYFADGDITYCPTNNTAAIFYSQSDNPNLTMEVYPIGRVTSDLSLFPDLPSRVDITFEVAE